MVWSLLKFHVTLVALPLLGSMGFALMAAGGSSVPAAAPQLVQNPNTNDQRPVVPPDDGDGPQVIAVPVDNPTPAPADDAPTPENPATSPGTEPTPAPASTAVQAPTASPAPPPTAAPTPAPTPSPPPVFTEAGVCAIAQAFATADMASVSLTFKSCTARAQGAAWDVEIKINNPECGADRGNCPHHSLKLKLLFSEADGSVTPADESTALILETY